MDHNRIQNVKDKFNFQTGVSTYNDVNNKKLLFHNRKFTAYLQRTNIHENFHIALL